MRYIAADQISPWAFMRSAVARVACTAAVASVISLAALPSWAAKTDGGKIAAALGKSGTEMPGGVYRVGLPRTDLHVTLDGVELKPGFALGSWLAFRADGNTTMVMGDLVLTEAEIAPVMTKLAERGIEITALHNHLLRAQPATFYMHVLGHGDAVTLATALHDGLDLDTAMVDKTLGAKGRVAGGVYQFGIARAETIKDDGMEVPVAMGSAEAINFQPTGGGKAAITGDFVLTATEVNPVLRALRQNGIEVTALHNHMLDDQPHLFFMHFWANDDAQKLATGLRAALDKINIARS
jgi:hypothetical protein